MAEDEEETLRVFRGHKEVFEKLVGLHRGRIFNTAGDAILAEFSSAVEAVRCATEIQAALRTRNDQLPETRQVQFRIGVNLGDVMVQGHDLLGDGVNIAARLQSAAAPGGVCISGSVYDQIRNRLSLSFKPLGDMNFKNIPQTVRTFSIIEAEGLGELPAPEIASGRKAAGVAKWVAAGVALLLIAGGGAFWVYHDHQHSATDYAGRVRSQAAKPPADRAPARADADHSKPQTDQSVAGAPVASPQSPPTAAAIPPAAADGVYGGPICFGAMQTLPAVCFPAEATLRQGRIAGEWPGRDPNTTMHIEGDVSAAGHATLRLHGKKSDGSHFAVFDFSGTLRDGALDATGTAANSRTATLNWRRRGEALTATAPAAPTPAAESASVAAPPQPATPTAPVAAPAPSSATPPSSAAATASASPSATTPNPAPGMAEGTYGGQVCFGPGPAEGARCFRAQATVQQGRITGQWPGNDPSVTMHLEGTVQPTGVVSIQMHADAADGKRRATINLTGTLRDGKLDATGAFLNGRSASMNWSKN
jgi:hypothetical protein